jgi:uncharacterized protein YcgI (DUF1989 family)
MAEVIEVPAREGRGVRLTAGQRFRVVDVEGGQVGDLFAFNAADPSECSSASHTRPHNRRAFPAPGQAFVTNRRRRILLVEEDTSSGVHDLLIAACDPERYRQLGVEGPHASCAENMARGLADIGVNVADTPQPINLFMNVAVHDDGTISLETSPSRAGDYVQFRAEMDCAVALSACPFDVFPISRDGTTGLRIEVLR